MQNCARRLDKHTQNPEDDLPWEDVAEFREGDCDEAHVLSVSWRSAANQSIGEDMIMIRIMDVCIVIAELPVYVVHCC